MTTPNEKRPILIELTFPAEQQDLWKMWTTKEGIESWWGPEGISSTVRAFEFQVDGLLEIVMRPNDSEGDENSMVEKITLTEITPMTCICFTDRFPGTPDVEPYDVICEVAFQPASEGTKMTFASSGMHREDWTEYATYGWRSAFQKLAASFSP